MSMSRIWIRPLLGCLAVGSLALTLALDSSAERAPVPPVIASAPAFQPRGADPAAWGDDHVGKPVPEFVAGDICLFCHRDRVGAGWSTNRHAQTIRPIETDDPEVKYAMGRGERQRLLRPSQSYGHLDLFAKDKDNALHWDSATFGRSCAGCHATAVNPETRAFAAASLDCGVCHGAVGEDHAEKREQVRLSRDRLRNEPARVVASICGQCHIRSGRSRSLGSPYPNSFIPGDNLFRDFQTDFSDEALARLHPADRHAMENLRDVATLGQERVTCLSCHDIHQANSRKHRRLPRARICWNCHQESGPMKTLKPEWTRSPIHSEVCGY